MSTITARELWSWGCYTEALGRAVSSSVSMHTILGLEDVPPSERIWIACKYLAKHDRSTLAAFAKACGDAHYTRVIYSLPGNAARFAMDASDASSLDRAEQIAWLKEFMQ